MKFRKLRIIQAGVTTNYGTVGEKTLPLNITDAAVQSVVALGNQKPIHCRRTHEGADLLDGYLGKFDNFVYEDGVAYADFNLSPALESAYPSEAKFISTMIGREPDMLGISVIGSNNQTENGDVIDITEFTKLYTCDIVGLPAATTSLFSNNQNESKMNKFFSAFASVFTSKNKFSTETVVTRDGSSITIEAVGESMAIGDKVYDSEGDAVADGEIVIVVDGQEAVIEIENGAIKEVKSVEPKEETKPDPSIEMAEEAKPEEEKEEKKSKAAPEEFSESIIALQAVIAEQGKQLAELAEKFSKASKAPTFGTGTTPVKTVGNITKLSRDAVQEAAKKYRK